MSEITIRDLTEVKELDAQAMSRKAGGHGGCMGRRYYSLANTQVQLAFVINSPGAVVFQNAVAQNVVVSQNAVASQKAFKGSIINQYIDFWQKSRETPFHS